MSISGADMKYDPSVTVKGQKMIEVYPDLLDYKEYKDPSDDKLLRIAFWATDEKSPFLKKDRDNYETRIKAIFMHEGIIDDGLMENIILNKDKKYSSIVNRFFIQVDNLAYGIWSNMLFNFHMIGIALRAVPDMNNLTAEMDKRAKLQTQQAELLEKLVAYEAQIFTDAGTRKILRKEVSKIITIPERYAAEKSVI
jgi:hypothetical protein